jgi:hypothetical protein
MCANACTFLKLQSPSNQPQFEQRNRSRHTHPHVSARRVSMWPKRIASLPPWQHGTRLRMLKPRVAAAKAHHLDS